MSQPRLKYLLRSIVPWLFAALLLFWLFQRYPFAQVLEALRQANIPAFVVFLLAYFLAFSALDIWSLQRTLRVFGTQGSLAQVARLRLASNLAMILNYGLGQGVLAYLIKKNFEDSFLRITSVLVLIIACDLYLAVSIAFAGSFFTSVLVGGLDLAPWIRMVWTGLTVCLISVVWLWHTERGGALVARLRTMRLFHALNIARPGVLIGVLLRRLPLLLLGTTYLWFLVRCFGASLPLEKVFALFPISMIVGAIPITPSGLGTEQVTTIFLFREFISGPAVSSGAVKPEELLLAISLAFTVAVYVLKLLSGIVFFPRQVSGKQANP